MVTFANAKINIGLNIVGRRPDGYHNLETIFYPAGKGCGTPQNPGKLCDILEVVKASENKFTQLGITADCPPEFNLVIGAYRLFHNRALDKGIKVDYFDVILEKHIPFGAGIGGGSSDATAMLKLLNSLYESPFDSKALEKMAVRLGADCPFFVENRPVFATGIGETFSPVNLNLSQYWLALVKPRVSISTRDAFSCITPQKPEISLEEAIRLPLEEWPSVIKNDFEVSAFAKYPELKELKAALYDCGALYASMSGSGSAFYGIFGDYEQAGAAVKKIECSYSDISRMLP